MTFRKINETTLRCIITQQDLRENRIDLDDLLEHKPQAMEYLSGILREAAMEENFRIDGPFTTMQVRVLQDDSICLTLTKGLEPNLMQELRRAEGQLPGPQPEEGQKENGCPACRHHRQAPGTALEPGAGDPKDSGAESAPGLYSYIFDTMADAVLPCRAVPESARIPSDLYMDESEHLFYLFFHTDTAEEGWEKILLALNEFGQPLELTSHAAAYITEHGKCILKGNAAAQLSRL